MNKLRLLFCLLFLAIINSSCHTINSILHRDNGDSRDYNESSGDDNTPANVRPRANIAEKYSALLNVDESKIQNGRLYAFIDYWMGTPYRFGGLDKDGIDCSGLAFLLEQQVYGVSIPRSTGEQINVIKRKYEEQLTEGDLVFFDYDGKKFSHVGIYLQNGYYVHASATKGVTITLLHDPYTYKYFSRCGSILDDPNLSPGK